MNIEDTPIEQIKAKYGIPHLLRAPSPKYYLGYNRSLNRAYRTKRKYDIPFLIWKNYFYHPNSTTNIKSIMTDDGEILPYNAWDFSLNSVFDMAFYPHVPALQDRVIVIARRSVTYIYDPYRNEFIAQSIGPITCCI